MLNRSLLIHAPVDLCGGAGIESSSDNHQRLGKQGGGCAGMRNQCVSEREEA